MTYNIQRTIHFDYKRSFIGSRIMKNLSIFSLKSTDYQFVRWKFFIESQKLSAKEMEQFEFQDNKHSTGKTHFVQIIPVDLRHTI